MTRANGWTQRPVGRGVWLALAGLTLWLLLQNSILLVWLTGRHLEPAFVVARALVRVGLHLVAEFWMLPVAVLLGVAVAVAGGSREAGRTEDREVSRV